MIHNNLCVRYSDDIDFNKLKREYRQLLEDLKTIFSRTNTREYHFNILKDKKEDGEVDIV